MMVWKRSWIILTWATSCEPAGHCSEMSTSPNVKNKTTLFQWKPNANSPRIMTAWLFWKWIQKLSWLRVCVSNMLWSTCRLFLEQINVFVLRIDSFSEHLSWTHGHKLASWPEEKWKIGNRNNLLLFRQLYFRAKPHCIWAFFFFSSSEWRIHTLHFVNVVEVLGLPEALPNEICNLLNRSAVLSEILHSICILERSRMMPSATRSPRVRAWKETLQHNCPVAQWNEYIGIVIFSTNLFLSSSIANVTPRFFWCWLPNVMRVVIS